MKPWLFFFFPVSPIPWVSFFLFNIFDFDHSRATYINKTAECVCWQPFLSIKLHRSISMFLSRFGWSFKSGFKVKKKYFHIVVTGYCFCGDLTSWGLPMWHVRTPVRILKVPPLAARRLHCSGAWINLGRGVRQCGWVELFQFRVCHPFHYFSKCFFILKSLLQDNSLSSRLRRHLGKGMHVYAFFYTLQWLNLHFIVVTAFK